MCRSFCVYLLALFFYNFVDCPYFIAKCFAISCVIVCVCVCARICVARKCTKNHFVYFQNERNFSFGNPSEHSPFIPILKEREENEDVGMRRRLSCLIFSRSRYCLKHSYILVSVVGIVICRPPQIWRKRTTPKNFRDNALFRPSLIWFQHFRFVFISFRCFFTFCHLWFPMCWNENLW